MSLYIIWFLLILSLSVSFATLIFAVKLARKLNSFEDYFNKSSTDYDADTSLLLARFQKITSAKLRALDNKIDAVDSLLKDSEASYSKVLSAMQDFDKFVDDNKKILKTIESLNDEETLQKFKKLEKPRKTSPKKTTTAAKKTSAPKKRSSTLPAEQTTVEPTVKDKGNISPQAELPDISSSDNTSGQSKKDKIFSLYSRGIAPSDIAKELGLGTGEVNLYIDLYKK
ncbi:MAG: hypothetical protein KBA07_05235 [Petrotogaceae bacterium]|nr:hypothetical protein [Petrotogaceae bacterium]